MYVSINKQLISFKGSVSFVGFVGTRVGRHFPAANVSMGDELWLEWACHKCCLGRREIIAVDSKNRTTHINTLRSNMQCLVIS
jgi:hypothetical protein